MPEETDRYLAWIKHADQLIEIVNGLLLNCLIPRSATLTRDPRFLAAALLMRSVSTFQALTGLIQQDFIVEARTLTRCCIENSFWINALNEKGESFVEEMKSDELKSLLDQCARHTKANPEFSDVEKLVKQQLAQAGHNIKGFKRINTGNLVKTIPDLNYMIYKEIFGDSAHPSYKALARMMVVTGDDKSLGLDATQQPDQEEVLKTVALTSLVMTYSSVIIGQMAGPKSSLDQLESLRQDWRQLWDILE